jgi:6-phosphogluconolactonase (cycloisomerase 2 family)
MIKKLIYILFFIQPLCSCYGQGNFFWSHTGIGKTCITDDLSYVRRFFVDDKDDLPRDLCLGNSGFIMYVIGDDNNEVYQYNLSSAYNVGTASHAQTLTLSTKSWTGITFHPEGWHMYLVNQTDSKIVKYTLDDGAWHLPNAEYDSEFDTSDEDNAPSAVAFSVDGTRMYVTGHQNDRIYQYNLSPAWNIASADYQTYISYSTDVTQTGIEISENGHYLLVTLSSNELMQIFLPRAHELSSCDDDDSCSTFFPSGGGNFSSPLISGLFLKNSDIYTIDILNQKIGQFTLD